MHFIDPSAFWRAGSNLVVFFLKKKLLMGNPLRSYLLKVRTSYCVKLHLIYILIIQSYAAGLENKHSAFPIYTVLLTLKS